MHSMWVSSLRRSSFMRVLRFGKGSLALVRWVDYTSSVNSWLISRNGSDSSFSRRTLKMQRQFTVSAAKSNTGLFMIPALRNPSDFITLASEAMAVCDDLRQSLDALEEVRSVNHASEVLRTLDDVSKTVCNVIDAAELCRSVHSSSEWREAANKAFALISDYIALLNADTQLYNALTSVTKSPYFSQLNEEEQRLAILLKAEFERDGIHLPEEERNAVRQLQQHVTQLETLFSDNITHSRKYFDVEAASAEEVIPRHLLEAHVPQSNKDPDKVTLSTDPHIANTLIKYSCNPGLRREVYMDLHTSCPENLEVLDALIERRHQVATRQGFESYADRFLRDKMAKDQSTVFRFLNNLRERIDARGDYKRDMELLSEAKRQVEGVSDGTIEPWDVPFYTGVLKAREGVDPSLISAYLTLSSCLEAMVVLVKELFGITMREEEMDEGERWDLDSTEANHDARIRKFVFEDETGRPLGTMYLDLHPRKGKYGHAAHFTVRCGCALGTSGEYQLPIVALVCNMSPPSVANVPVLTHSEVETLFHEFGHALHSLLSRTTFQHLSGTRGAMDFVETPSHLFEQYAWDSKFLSILARHHETGEMMPEEMVHQLVQSRNQFRAIDIQNQILYALFDQALFGAPDMSKPTTTEVFAKLHHNLHVPLAEGTHWHSRFGHLVTYGAGYYGYLYAQVFAGDIWTSCFVEDSLKREAGRNLWTNMLVHGGAKDPNVMLRDLLGREPRVDSFLQSIGSS